jgi:hypothetical protein
LLWGYAKVDNVALGVREYLKFEIPCLTALITFGVGTLFVLFQFEHYINSKFIKKETNKSNHSQSIETFPISDVCAPSDNDRFRRKFGQLKTDKLKRIQRIIFGRKYQSVSIEIAFKRIEHQNYNSKILATKKTI